MADFLTAYKICMKIEGGYACDPDDTGGETFAGISRRNFSSWKGWAIVDTAKRAVPNYVKNVAALDALLFSNAQLQTLVQSFYKANFWDVLKCDFVKEQNIATELFDTGVNCGTGVSALFLQQSLNVLNNNGKAYADITEDAQIGTTTINMLNAHPRPNEVLKCLNGLQFGKYFAICRANPKQEKFFRSWLSRVALY